MELNDKVFIITGGSSGLGAATAEVFAAAGARIAVFDRDEAHGKTVAQATGAKFYPVDVTDDRAVQQAVDDVVGHFNVIHGAVNCAGIAIAARVVGKQGVHSLDAFHRVLLVNVVGTFNVIRRVAWAISQLPSGEEEERGVIINTASIAAFEGQIGQAAYSASKGAVAGMTLPIARELAHYGIRVMTIAPGIFDTPMLGLLSEDIRRSLSAQIPFPSRLGNPKEYALLARHIVENPMLNGEIIRLDGAIRMGPR
ncbi:MAG: 3-hydroxyacyl-CoA dehydrogenase [Sulfobacillus benefaciens]|uniref:3-hydroxyacyl-CoA dehydrogenase n=1 Tax=Sulfobacillus benefaciens TaxID=453960 RepID=A0A2T2WWL3_9FIRM|nr:MAG: 3-hydroxyacyl-CoA dehydrogenase [Sulfobacillus benefaciens]